MLRYMLNVYLQCSDKTLVCHSYADRRISLHSLYKTNNTSKKTKNIAAIQGKLLFSFPYGLMLTKYYTMLVLLSSTLKYKEPACYQR